MSDHKSPGRAKEGRGGRDGRGGRNGGRKGGRDGNGGRGREQEGRGSNRERDAGPVISKNENKNKDINQSKKRTEPKGSQNSTSEKSSGQGSVSPHILKFCEALKKKVNGSNSGPFTLAGHEVANWKGAFDVASTGSSVLRPFYYCLLKSYTSIPETETFVPAVCNVIKTLGHFVTIRQAGHTSHAVIDLSLDVIKQRLSRSSSMSTIRSESEKTEILRLFDTNLSESLLNLCMGLSENKMEYVSRVSSESSEYKRLLQNHVVVERESSASRTVSEGWYEDPTVQWMTDARWLSTQGLKSSYDNVNEYIEVMRELWTSLTFYLGAAALWPKCRCQFGDKTCGNPLMTATDRTTLCSMRIKVDGKPASCDGEARWRCFRGRQHDAICDRCLAAKKTELCGVPGHGASTDVYDAEILIRSSSGESDLLTLCKLRSRNPPQVEPKWRTTYRLQSPNLVGVVVISVMGEPLRPSYRLYFGEIVPHSRLPSNNEAVRRQNGFLDIRLLSHGDAGVINPEFSCLPAEVNKGCRVAVIDMQVFVPEVFSVLATLTDKAFQNGLQRVPFGKLILNGVPPEPPNLGPMNSHRDVIWTAIYHSRIRAIKMLSEELRVAFFDKIMELSVVKTLDRTQLEAFALGLSCDLHCTQGPPGTGKVSLVTIMLS